MVTHFIYASPTWLWGGIMVALFVVCACVGLTIFHRLVRVEVRRADNDLTGFTAAIISVTYAVLLAFIAIATWQAFSEAEGLTVREAGHLSAIYRDTQGLPPALADEIRAQLRQYVGAVIEEEWPEQERGVVPKEGWAPLTRVHRDIVTMQPRSLGEAVIQAELLRTLNDLYKARASRLAAVEGHIPSVIWWIIFAGGALTTGFTYLFGFHDFRMHLVVTAAVAASLVLVIVLIVALDWPFRGAVSITPDAFVKAQASWADLPSNAK